MPTQEELNGGFNLGDWEVLPSQRVLRRNGEVITPEPMVFDVLIALAKRDGDLVTKDELIDEVWKGKAFSDEPIQQKISQLRSHFEDKKPFNYVGTLHRKGYHLLQPVELHAPSEAGYTDPPALVTRSLTWWKTVALTIAAAFVAVIVWLWTISESAPAASLAILPIENLSGDAAKGHIAESIHRTLGRRLSEIPNHTIKMIRLPHDGSWAKMRRDFAVESLLIASVQIENGAVMVVYQVIGDNDAVILAGEESGSVGNLFALQERLAKKIYGELAGSSAPELIELVAPDSLAYASYSRGMYMLEHRFEKLNLEESIRLFQESIALDESYGPAYVGLATAYALLPDYREMPLQESLDRAIATIDKGVLMDPSIADPAGAIYGFEYYQRKEWSKAEASYERAVNASVVDSNAFSWYSQMLANVGRLYDSRDVALRGAEIDPDSTVLNSRIAMIYTWLDNKAQASEYFQRAHDLDATGIIHNMAYVLFLTRSGKFDMARDLTFAAAREADTSNAWIDPVFRGLQDPAHAAEALAGINAAWAEQSVIPHIVILARTMLGDVDGAMEIARLLKQPGETFSMEILFIDELTPLRQHPDFIPLLQELGVVDYWREAGCRWEDDRVSCTR